MSSEKVKWPRVTNFILIVREMMMEKDNVSFFSSLLTPITPFFPLLLEREQVARSLAQQPQTSRERLIVESEPPTLVGWKQGAVQSREGCRLAHNPEAGEREGGAGRRKEENLSSVKSCFLCLCLEI